MSKSLEALERLRNTLLAEGYWQDILQDVFTIEKELKEGEKAQFKLKALGNFVLKSKALEIIKDKKVDVPFIIENPEAENVFWYNSSFTGVLCEGWRMISQEEWDLLREVLL